MYNNTIHRKSRFKNADRRLELTVKEDERNIMKPDARQEWREAFAARDAEYKKKLAKAQQVIDMGAERDRAAAQAMGWQRLDDDETEED